MSIDMRLRNFIDVGLWNDSPSEMLGKSSGRPLAASTPRHSVLLLLDVDRFKAINDTLGHAVGDAVIARLGDALRSRLRSADVVARLGGDEFAAILRRLDLPAAREVARDLQAVAAQCAGLPVERICAELLARMAPPSGYRDDVVVLALRPSHVAAGSFATVVPAAPAQIPVAREHLRDWLNTIVVVPHRETDILLATGEAVTNAIEHGSRNEQRETVSVEAFLQEDAVIITVSDTGQWVGDSSASLRSRRRG